MSALAIFGGYLLVVLHTGLLGAVAVVAHVAILLLAARLRR